MRHIMLYSALRAVPWARALPRSSRERRYRLLVSLPPLKEGEGESFSRMICGVGEKQCGREELELVDRTGQDRTSSAVILLYRSLCAS
jgi:hypothetical protein